ncbi:MAG: hypothetical protein WEB52_01500 [Dehalococcoidia bacterium]
MTASDGHVAGISTFVFDANRQIRHMSAYFDVVAVAAAMRA